MRQRRLGYGENRADFALGQVVRGGALLVPIGASMGFVYAATRVVEPPSELSGYVLWWVGLSVLATTLVVATGRLVRRLLPIHALLRLSFVLPDGAPSRFRIALRSMTVASLRERLESERGERDEDTPAEAAARLLGLVALLDTHDAITRGHSERVRAYAQSIGRELGLSRDELALLNWAALLHDIGKLDIPREVLRKREELTEREWALIRRHPEAGARLAAPLHGWLGDWSLGIEHHHERYDGSGYPRGLRGEEISLAGRIIAVADAFDVITSSRPYSPTASAAAARAELAQAAGTQFDPAVVRTFLAISVRSRRVISGPLAWLAQASVLARVPVGATAGVVSVAVATAVAPVQVVPGTVIPSASETPIAIVERPIVRPMPSSAPAVRRDTNRTSSRTAPRRAKPAPRATQSSPPSSARDGQSTTLAAAPATPVTTAAARSSKESKPKPASTEHTSPARRAKRTLIETASPRAHERSAHTRAVPPRGLAKHVPQSEDPKPEKDKQHEPPVAPAVADASAPAPPGPPETPGHEDGHANGKRPEQAG